MIVLSLYPDHVSRVARIGVNLETSGNHCVAPLVHWLAFRTSIAWTVVAKDRRLSLHLRTVWCCIQDVMLSFFWVHLLIHYPLWATVRCILNNHVTDTIVSFRHVCLSSCFCIQPFWNQLWYSTNYWPRTTKDSDYEPGQSWGTILNTSCWHKTDVSEQKIPFLLNNVLFIYWLQYSKLWILII